MRDDRQMLSCSPCLHSGKSVARALPNTHFTAHLRSYTSLSRHVHRTIHTRTSPPAVTSMAMHACPLSTLVYHFTHIYFPLPHCSLHGSFYRSSTATRNIDRPNGPKNHAVTRAHILRGGRRLAVIDQGRSKTQDVSHLQALRLHQCHQRGLLHAQWWRSRRRRRCCRRWGGRRWRRRPKRRVVTIRGHKLDLG